MQIRGMLIGSGATVLVAAGIFTAVAMANADDQVPATTVTPTATQEVAVPAVPTPEVTVPAPTATTIETPVVGPTLVVPAPAPTVEAEPITPATVAPTGQMPEPSRLPVYIPQGPVAPPTNQANADSTN